jgi:hypothetical protein
MQISNLEPFVRDCIVSIGALVRSLDTEVVQASQLQASKATELSKLHRQYAVMKYGKAVKLMHTVLLTAELKQMLVAFLLVFCFEILLNNRHPAISHLVSGQHLYRDWLTRAVSVNNVLLPPTGSSLQPILEDELIDAFEHLDVQICTIYDSRPIHVHQRILRDSIERIRQMPLKFASLAEARGYLSLVMRRCQHFQATTWVATDTSALSREFEMMFPGDICNTVVAGVNIFSTPRIIPESLRTK